MAGPSKPDMELARRVRSLTLKKIEKLFVKEDEGVLESSEYELYKAVLIKLAGTVLPRTNEITGEEGGPIKIELSEQIANKLYAPPQDPGTSSE